jgi:uncharacterized protein YchJ
MTKTRNNHYVPQWYQEGFFEPGTTKLSYLDMAPPQRELPDGRIIIERSRFTSVTAQCFRERDLYSTFFGTSVNDEIECKLFGMIDSSGSKAVKAFIGTDVAQWIERFQEFYTYIDAQKLRTPKGLRWLQAQYPALDQNELMAEMQGMRMMHCTIWSEGVREIVSAEDAEVKFIISDHQVTIYNHAVPPEAPLCAYPLDPGIALKASQTIFPLNREFCLILTNLEYAKDAQANPLEKRTFARNFRSSMFRADALIRTRKLSGDDVSRINYILKRRARRYLAAGREEWLYPETTVNCSWEDLRDTLRPPENGLFGFGGEMYAKFDDGHVHYQDEFGRTEKKWDFLEKKKVDARDLRPGSACGCGSGERYKDCCKARPELLRPTWAEPSIRQRNMFFQQAVADILGIGKGKDWVEVRKTLTDEQISRVYSLFAALWASDTDLLQLLPKPDGRARAIYTGPIHPSTIVEFAQALPLYFGEVLIQNPFVHAGGMRKEFSPVENPRAYRQEFLKSTLFFFTMMPFVEAGLINLFPDPCIFDPHLRHQMFGMAEERLSGIKLDPEKEPRLKQFMRDDFERGIWALPPDALRNQIRKAMPGLDDAGLDNVVAAIEKRRIADPLAVLQGGSLDGGKDGGLLNLFQLSPNFEIVMYLAQATGACIVTDSTMRWEEILRAIRTRHDKPRTTLAALADGMKRADFSFPSDMENILTLSGSSKFAAYAGLIREAFRYAKDVDQREAKPNFEIQLASRFGKVHAAAQELIAKGKFPAIKGRLSCAFPWGGIQDNTINRLLLMSSSEHHLQSVPMAFYVERPKHFMR